MLIKLGVSIKYLNREIRRQLNLIDYIYRQHGEEVVIVSTREGNHSPSSLHYTDNAIDIRSPATRNMKSILQKLNKHIDAASFDIVNEKNHIHIEYDPKS